MYNTYLSYMQIPLAEFSLVDDIAKGLPIPHTPLRLPNVSNAFDADYVTANQNKMRKAAGNVLDNQAQANNYLAKVDEFNPNYMDDASLEELQKNPQKVRSLKKYMSNASDLIDEASEHNDVYHTSKDEITRLARQYSNTPYNVRQRNR